jgi:hypothetical protein
MTEVGGDAAYLIPRRPASSTTHWAENAARQVEEIINLTGSDLEHVINVSLSNASRFDQTTALNKIEEIYLKVIKQSKTS